LQQGYAPVYDEDLKHLDEWIRRLKIEYDIFFIGNRKKPPDDLRMRVEKLVKRLAEVGDMSFSQRFLYNTLIARFYVYRDLWRRTQQEHESAEGAVAAPVPDQQNAPRDQPETSMPRDVQVSISDPEIEAGNVRRLYDELLRLKGSHAKESPEISYHQFAAYIANQMRGIKTKHHCNSVTFRIALEDKTIKFVAKADISPLR
jgi:hypothetical protein